MVEPLRHRQTKGAETDMLSLTSPRHISTLPTPVIPKAQMAVILRRRGERVRSTYCGHLTRAARQSRNLQEPGSGGGGFQFVFAPPEFDRRRVPIGRREQALGTICRIASKGLPMQNRP